MYILGISCYYHDSAAALIKDGILVAAAEEERFSRIKHDSSFPKFAIEFCLRKANIKVEDVSYVVFYEKPFLKFERIFLNSISFVPSSLSFFKDSMKEWFFDKLWIKSHIVGYLGIPAQKLLFCEHHLSHAASAFFCSPFKKSAVITIDGVGEFATAAWGTAEDKIINLKEEMHFPDSFGLLYSVFTVFAGFEANEGEYKLMGLAPYGKPRYIEKIYKLLYIFNDGSFSLNLEYFSYHKSARKIHTKKFEELFGGSNVSPDKVSQYYADIAASMQFVLEETIGKLVNYVYQKTKLQNLCYAGGVALNGVANWKIANKSPFGDIFIQPAAGDSGGALGAALWAYHTVLKKKRNFIMTHTYYGDWEKDGVIKKFLEKENVKYKKAPNEMLLIEEIIHNLKQGKVIGWVQKEFEWGPRALGHRSILADPRSKKMKDIVNRKIKFREAFRPFAPSIIAEEANNYFSTDKKEKQFPFRFMLYVLPVRENKREKLGAITHVDGTSRPQFVYSQTNPRYHHLIKSFGEETNTPVLLNTSFNLKGEPIVNTTEDALKTFQKSGIDILVINDFIIKKK